jgi:mono/diheme cytochrome c family protein
MRRILCAFLVPMALAVVACSGGESSENEGASGLQPKKNPNNPDNTGGTSSGGTSNDAGTGGTSSSGSGGTSNGGAGGTGGTSSGGAGTGGSAAGAGGTTEEPIKEPPPWNGSAQKGSVPMTGGTLLVLKDGKTAVAADPDRDMVSIVDLTGPSVKAQIQLPIGSEPGRMVQDDSGQVHVALRRGGGVATIDLFSGMQVGLRQVCAMPRGLAHRASDNALLIACAAGDLVTLSADATQSQPLARVKVKHEGATVFDLRDVILKGGSTFVTTFRQAQVLKVQSDGTVLGAPVGLGVRKDTSAEQLKAEGLGGGVEQNYIPALAWRSKVGSTGEILIAHQGGTDRVINVSTSDNGGGTQQNETTTCSKSGYGGKTCVTTKGKPICTPPVLVGLVSSVSETGEVYNGPALPSGALPVDIARSKNGKSYSVVLGGNINGASQDGAPLRNVVRVPAIDTSGSPADSSDKFDRDLCGLDFKDGVTLPGQPTSIDMDGQGREVVLSREPAALYIVSGSQVTEVPLSGTSVANEGYNLFHTNTGRGMSCAGCHAEGQDDARTWRFTPEVDKNGQPVKEIARRTQTFRAGFLDTAPFHWDAEFAGVEDLMNDVFVHRMGAPSLPTPERQGALEAWMNNILPKQHDFPSAEEQKSIARGKQLFNDSTVGCADCHSGSNLTNNKNHDIGFGYATQVPSLIDVAFRGPFLHDGSAPTLESRFYDVTAQSGKHGATSQLSKEQLADLIAYLESL